VATDPALIVQVPRGGAVDRQLEASPPRSVTDGEVVVSALASGGEVVLSVPSPEALERDSDDVRRVIAQAGTGTEPLVVEVEAAEELRDEELAAVVEAAGHTERPVSLRIVRDA
jgi:hypothetical protein